MLVLQFLAVRHTTERAGRTRAVIVRDADSDARGQPREHRQLCPNALVSGLVGHGPRHEEPRPPLHLNHETPT